MWIIGGVLLLDLVFIVLFYKELKITLFDPVYASLLGFNTALINILLMSLVSLTIVSVFKVAGRINSTFGGNLVDMVRATRYLQIIDEDNLVANASRVGH